jgi:uncharacterized membrane protein YeaQ/YmgE (transglycosylase-associated protein family)
VSNLGTVVTIMISAFLTGGLARLAVPGPDPMPAWLTVSIGLVGSVVGGAIAAIAFDRDPYAVSLGAFFAAVLLVVVYRKFIQKRPIFGVEAMRFPRRGVGVEEYRQRLAKAGVDPDAMLDRALAAQRRDAEEAQRSDEEDDTQEDKHDRDETWGSGS